MLYFHNICGSNRGNASFFFFGKLIMAASFWGQRSACFDCGWSRNLAARLPPSRRVSLSPKSIFIRNHVVCADFGCFWVLPKRAERKQDGQKQSGPGRLRDAMTAEWPPLVFPQESGRLGAGRSGVGGFTADGVHAYWQRSGILWRFENTQNLQWKS